MNTCRITVNPERWKTIKEAVLATAKHHLDAIDGGDLEFTIRLDHECRYDQCIVEDDEVVIADKVI